ncbi:flagellar hook-length control protein FliK [Carnobacterium sp.]|uniref:flagellar hook-length control protein FliK n=1 Tax=Carnobacterium sp. TaxID=48221 RepID=UPI00388D00D3
MNPTPVVTTSTGPQQLSNQKQEIVPEEFETQLAGYLKKEQPGTIHKEVSDSEGTTEKDNQDKESNKEPNDETIILESPLLYTGLLFSPNTEQQTIETNLFESSKTEMNPQLKSSEPIFGKQMDDETEKIVAIVQNEDPLANTKHAQLEEPFVEPLTKEKKELQKSVVSQTAMNEEPTKTAVSKPMIDSELIRKTTEEIPLEKETNLSLEESSLIQTENVRSSMKKETVLADVVLSNGRFLTAEWKNGRLANQIMSEPNSATVNSLNELPVQINETQIDSDQQPEAMIDESKLTKLTEIISTEIVLKDSVSRLKNSDSYEAVTQFSEVETQGQSVQQQQIIETASVKQANVLETVKHTGLQMVNEVVMEQAETVLSGKQSTAHVTLTPERMGEVKITVELTDNVLVTKIIVDNVETRELLTTGMNQLTDKLDRQNIRLGDLTIQVNENPSSDFTSQERQGEEKKSTFGKQQTNFTANEKEILLSEATVESNTKRLSILV